MAWHDEVQKLRPPFDSALEMCADASLPGSRENWTETLLEAQSFADRGLSFSDAQIPPQQSSLLVLLLLAQLGEEPQQSLVAELECRVECTMTRINNVDARTIRDAIKAVRDLAPRSEPETQEQS